MAHTPGPWAISEESGCIIAPIETPLIHDHHYYGGELIAESIHREDDQRLIAAAPEMAESLKRLHLTYNSPGITPKVSPLEEAEMWSEVLKIIDKIKPVKQYITFSMAIQHLADGKTIGCDGENGSEVIAIDPGENGLVKTVWKGKHFGSVLTVSDINSHKWYVIEEEI